jgi:dTDP-4-dehydrorhamnose 3,5-epimerase
VRVTPGAIPGILVIEPVRHEDSRGYFIETFQDAPYREAGLPGAFVQDNVSRSRRNVLRGLHYQRRQGKLITVVRGEIFDVAVDVRPDSETFGRWLGTRLSDENGLQLYVPPGFAHGFAVLSDEADVWYKTTDVYRPEEEGGIRWDDPDLAIDWPISNPTVSDRDRRHPALRDVDRTRLITLGEIAALASG